MPNSCDCEKTTFVRAPETKFLKIGLVFGLLFVFIVPPFQVPDEFDHFFKAYLVSKGNFVTPVRENGSTYVKIPKALQDFSDAHEYLVGNMSAKYSYNQF